MKDSFIVVSCGFSSFPDGTAEDSNECWKVVGERDFSDWNVGKKAKSQLESGGGGGERERQNNKNNMDLLEKYNRETKHAVSPIFTH